MILVLIRPIFPTRLILADLDRLIWGVFRMLVLWRITGKRKAQRKVLFHVNKSRPIHLKHPGDPTHPENSAWHSMAITRTACWRDNHRLRVTSDPSIVTCLNFLEWTHARLQKIERRIMRYLQEGSA